MICSDCRIAGNNSLFYRQCDGTLAEHTHREIRKEHKRCPGGTWCDCQHDISEVRKITIKTTTE